jgi:hypothetical protein
MENLEKKLDVLAKLDNKIFQNVIFRDAFIES